jgi:tetratricopeptide (TPR) repeat protein
MQRGRRARDHGGMTEDLDGRLRRLRTSADVDALIALGCDLAHAGRHRDAEDCFRRATGLGDATGAFDLGNALAAQERWEDAASAYEVALSRGEADAWRNLGLVLERMGDVAGALWAYRGAADAGDVDGGMQLALLLRNQGEAERAFAVAEELAAGGAPLAGAVLACWRWCAVRDVRLEDELRAGADLYAPARKDLSDLLITTGRTAEARSVLERGAKRGEPTTWLPLGNFYADEMRDEEAAEEAYRAGIAAGDVYCHHNLGVLLAERGDFDGAVEQFHLGADEGDELAIEALRDLGVV